MSTVKEILEVYSRKVVDRRDYENARTNSDKRLLLFWFSSKADSVIYRASTPAAIPVFISKFKNSLRQDRALVEFCIVNYCKTYPDYELFIGELSEYDLRDLTKLLKEYNTTLVSASAAAINETPKANVYVLRYKDSKYYHLCVRRSNIEESVVKSTVVSNIITSINTSLNLIGGGKIAWKTRSEVLTCFLKSTGVSSVKDLSDPADWSITAIATNQDKASVKKETAKYTLTHGEEYRTSLASVGSRFY